MPGKGQGEVISNFQILSIKTFYNTASFSSRGVRGVNLKLLGACFTVKPQ